MAAVKMNRLTFGKNSERQMRIEVTSRINLLAEK
jgi:hypothetical protein